jgi:hypothetical protein
VSGPSPDPPPMRKLATFRKLTRAGGEVYWVARVPGAKLIFCRDEKGDGDYVLLQVQELDPPGRKR